MNFKISLAQKHKIKKVVTYSTNGPYTRYSVQDKSILIARPHLAGL